MSQVAEGENHVRNKFFKVLFCINGKKDSIKLFTFGTWIIISEYVNSINYLTN